MKDNLHRLVYYSRNRLDKNPAAMRAEIEGILAISRRNNAPIGITGALMFNAGCFGQVLEGRREVLESTFERIQRDERHGDVTLLALEAVPVRHFGHWSMGFVGGSASDAAAYAHVAANSAFDPSRASGDEVLEALTRLAIDEEAA